MRWHEGPWSQGPVVSEPSHSIVHQLPLVLFPMSQDWKAWELVRPLMGEEVEPWILFVVLGV